MTLFHAVVALDHEAARILEFDAEHVQAHKVKAHHHVTRHHHSDVRTLHEYYAEVCEALAGIAEVLVTGSKTTLADFRHYVEKYRPQCVKQVVGYEVVDHPTEGQLLAMARRYFVAHDRMAGVPTPT